MGKIIAKENDIIVLPHGCQTKLAREIGCSDVTVRNALKCIKTMSPETFINIRNKAMNFYGGRILL